MFHIGKLHYTRIATRVALLILYSSMAVHPEYGNISTVKGESFLAYKSSVREKKKKSIDLRLQLKLFK
jgi:hypothetical protein